MTDTTPLFWATRPFGPDPIPVGRGDMPSGTTMADLDARTATGAWTFHATQEGARRERWGRAGL